MGLSRYRLGDFIELVINKNDELTYTEKDVRGVNNLKKLMPTKADLMSRDLTKFQIVAPGEFVFNHRTSRNGSKFSIAYNDTKQAVICTEDYVVFKVKEKAKAVLSSVWLYMLFNRSEFDRYVITNSWGSSTEFYNWSDICAIEIDLPPLAIQQKYVDVYNAMIANQQCYERGLDDLKVVCDAYIEELRRKTHSEKIGPYIGEFDIRNTEGDLGEDSVVGISTQKTIIKTKANLNGVNVFSYKLFPPRYFAYVSDTSRRGDKISLCFNNTRDTYLVSSISTVFFVSNNAKLNSEYLFMYFTRSEFDRYARFHSWGSARETFTWNDLIDVEIPIPSIEIQQSIVDIYKVYLQRKEINERLKEQIKSICPILIKGSLEEARKKEV